MCAVARGCAQGSHFCGLGLSEPAVRNDTGAQIAAALRWSGGRVQKAASFKMHESMLEIGTNWHLDQQLNDMERD